MSKPGALWHTGRGAGDPGKLESGIQRGAAAQLTRQSNARGVCAAQLQIWTPVGLLRQRLRAKIDQRRRKPPYVQTCNQKKTQPKLNYTKTGRTTLLTCPAFGVRPVRGNTVAFGDQDFHVAGDLRCGFSAP